MANTVIYLDYNDLVKLAKGEEVYLEILDDTFKKVYVQIANELQMTSRVNDVTVAHDSRSSLHEVLNVSIMDTSRISTSVTNSPVPGT